MAYKTLITVFLISAVPLAILLALEIKSPSNATSYPYQSQGWFRECSKWDDHDRRFIVSFMEGGIGQISVPKNEESRSPFLKEDLLVKDADLGGNGTLGLRIDRPRNRLVVAVADVWGNRFGAVASYDLSTWRRLFLTVLAGPEDGESLADDVAVDEEGNAYVTDAKGNRIWKVGPKGELLSTIMSKAFSERKEWYYNLVGLNGIAYHPNGYLLVLHTSSGALFKVDIATEEVTKVVLVRGSLITGDGIELLSPTKLAVAGAVPSCRVVTSSDDWVTAAVVERYMGPMHRFASSVTVKDGKVYVNHLFGLGLWQRKHLITEAVFSPL
ncbi:hypothetical protein AMTRI_Chr02g223430 [Amborella trichopoda]|uniref:SMP-30/Gluconolactonase/LRE-like region domain-containing protein n=1 Tax=Amborella trichopoda TaxID=13333 RepID=W1NWW6_AMBTC|nr:uncharacterized protein LOC18430230 [Amborella trichopoda]ERN02127.1 hypothetical protein AMTR_s00045p00172820 [Amborella trichopoda]|eukprot:XP_006840452.1 uncharacterized protein LOC18430230 [Amborella trichopoda]